MVSEPSSLFCGTGYLINLLIHKFATESQSALMLIESIAETTKTVSGKYIANILFIELCVLRDSVAFE